MKTRIVLALIALMLLAGAVTSRVNNPRYYPNYPAGTYQIDRFEGDYAVVLAYTAHSYTVINVLKALIPEAIPCDYLIIVNSQWVIDTSNEESPEW